MALSCLEQRMRPLEFAYLPFGPGGLPPWTELLEEDEEGTPSAKKIQQRSRSWGGFRAWQPEDGDGCEDASATPTSVLREADWTTSDDMDAAPGQADKFHMGLPEDVWQTFDDVAMVPARMDKFHMGLPEEDGSTTRGSSDLGAKATEGGQQAGLMQTGGISGARGIAMPWRRVPHGQEAIGTASSRGYPSATDLEAAPHQYPLPLREYTDSHTTDESGQPHSGSDVESERAPEAEVITTLMVQNLRQSQSRNAFIRELDSLGFKDQYDYVHLPKTFGSGRNRGFAFVNFIDEEIAMRFWSLFPDDTSSSRAPTNERTWTVFPADVQGFAANAAVADSPKMRRVRKRCHKPLVIPQAEGVANATG